MNTNLNGLSGSTRIFDADSINSNHIECLINRQVKTESIPSKRMEAKTQDSLIKELNPLAVIQKSDILKNQLSVFFAELTSLVVLDNIYRGVL